MFANWTPILIEIRIIDIVDAIRPYQLLLIDLVKIGNTLLSDGLLSFGRSNMFVVLVYEPANLLFWSPKWYL